MICFIGSNGRFFSGTYAVQKMARSFTKNGLTGAVMDTFSPYPAGLKKRI